MVEEAAPARVLIADDHPLVRDGLQAMLEKDSSLMVIGEAKNGREAVAMCDELLPDLILMDVRMPEMDGLTATKEIKHRHPTICVLIVTTHENPDYLLEAIKVGAAGYVLKDSTRHRLIDSVRRALEGDNPLDEGLAAELLKRMIKTQDEVQSSYVSQPLGRLRRELPNSLTPREREVLKLLAPGRSNKEMAKILVVSPGTIKNHVQHIIRKLGVSDRTQAAIRAFEAGLLNSETSDR